MIYLERVLILQVKNSKSKKSPMVFEMEKSYKIAHAKL